MNFIKNRFTWNCIAAVLGIILTGCYIWEKDIILSFCWGLISVCNIALACLNIDNGDNNHGSNI